MLVEELDVNFFGGIVGGILDDDQDAFSKKSPSITAIFQSSLECKEKHISAMKARAKPLFAASTVLADGGKWNVSTSVKKDHEGNTSARANAHVEKETKAGTYYIDASAEARKDKNQQVQTGVSVTTGVGGNF